MIPEGKYKAKGVEGALGVAGTGNEQIAILVEITEGEYAGEQLTWYGYFTDRTTERTFQSLRYLGWQGDDLTDLRGLDTNEVQIVIKHEDDPSGKPRARVQWINGPGGLAMKDRMDDGAAKAFAQRMKGFAIASRKANGGTPQRTEHRAPNNGTRSPATQRRTEEAPPFDDDLPF